MKKLKKQQKQKPVNLSIVMPFRESNGKGRFRPIGSLGEVEQAGYDAADNLIKNFPPKNK